MPLPVLFLVLALSTIVCGADGVASATGMVCRQLSWSSERWAKCTWSRQQAQATYSASDLRVTSMQYCGLLTSRYK